MVKLKAKKVDGNVVISEGSFEHLLNCLDNQKFVDSAPCCGDEIDMAINDPVGYKQVKVDMQSAIDDFGRQCRKVLHETS